MLGQKRYKRVNMQGNRAHLKTTMEWVSVLLLTEEEVHLANTALTYIYMLSSGRSYLVPI